MTKLNAVFALLFAFALSGCGEVNAPGGAPGAPQTSLTSGPAPEQCDPPAAPIGTGVDVRGEIAATSAPYPANARYYCFSLPAGVQQATLRLSGLSADLDLYLGHGSINTVQGVDLNAGQNYQWKSNAFGTVDETIVLAAPAAGIYYVEIVSYQGEHSPFVLNVR
jgi:hypothetical protein